MKKWRVAVCLLAGMVTSAVWADARSELQSRLGKVNSFQAHFTQKVIAADGANVQDASGELWVQRPNLFRWHTTQPDESLLISDGETLWFYNPFVEQVTANWLNSATSNTPFILIARNQNSDWNQYTITQNGDQFKLTPTRAETNLKQFELTVSKEGSIQGFTAVEQDGQRSTYQLSGQKNGKIERAQFQFTVPKGVTLDDQRQRQR